MGFVRNLTGSTAAKAATKAADIQAQAGQDAIAELQRSKDEALGFIDPSTSQQFLQPFQQLGQQGLEQASFLTDPQAQFDFLQNNPLFASALENANTQTQQSAAARGRLSAGDTLQQLSQNTLLAASPLIQQQNQNIQGLLDRGLNVAGRQAGIEQNAQQLQANAALGTGSNVAGLTTDIGAALAGGKVGAANARGQGATNLLNLAGGIGGFFGG